MYNENEILGCGAEATVHKTEYLGRNAVVKMRSPKRYRDPELDTYLRSTRTKNEARIMAESRKAGVRTPVIYDIDINECSITMEHIDGRKIKDMLDNEPSAANELCKKIGVAISRLHNGRISHGDLTTSNMILMPDGEICLIDLSMGSTLAEIEDLGVDIHLMQRAFTSAHSDLDAGMDVIIDSYVKNMNDADAVLKRVDEIRGRGRYT
ncbi:MAG: Kae1-associated serine/threonine protein kinase [Methanomassiliicoccaceae archaeon]|nr:Kae1-associated serine/threonine protein kinase [Methanomassiliicoccaceae archaeon]